MIVAIVQARVTSTRLPKKVFLRYNGVSVLEHIYSRLSQSKYLNKVIFAIPSNKKNMILRNYLKKKDIPFIVGPEINVLKRFYKVCKILNPKIIIRVTADCPLIDFKLMDNMIKKFLVKKKFDFLSNSITRTYPDGLDIEIFKNDNLFESYEIKLDVEISLNVINRVKDKIYKHNPRKYLILSSKIKESDKSKIDSTIDAIKIEHGCEIILLSPIDYIESCLIHMNFINKFILLFNNLVLNDKELKLEHKKAWQEIYNNFNKI